MTDQNTRLLARDPIARTTSLFHYDPATGNFWVEDLQDVEPVLDLATESYKNFDERAKWKGDFHHVASIPMVVLQDLKKKGILDDKKKFKAWLNDRDNRCFRTRPGRV